MGMSNGKCLVKLSCEHTSSTMLLCNIVGSFPHYYTLWPNYPNRAVTLWYIQWRLKVTDKMNNYGVSWNFFSLSSKLIAYTSPYDFLPRSGKRTFHSIYTGTINKNICKPPHVYTLNLLNHLWFHNISIVGDLGLHILL